MLSFFRRNLIFNLVSVILFCILLHTYHFIYYKEVAIEWQLDFFDSLLSFSHSRVGKYFLSITLISIQALLLNNLVVKNRLSRVLSTIPAALFVICACFALESEIFHPILLANLFALLSLSSLFKIYKKHLPIATIFNSGFFLSIAALIYSPYIIFLILLFLGLITLRNLEIKEFLQLVIGVLAPLYLIGVYFFYTDALPLLSQHFLSNAGLPWKGTTFHLVSLLKPTIFLISFAVLVLFSSSLTKKKKYDAIKKIELSYWMLFLTILSTFLIKNLTESHLLICSIPVAILGGLIMESKPNKVIKEFLFLIMVATFLAFQFGVV